MPPRETKKPRIIDPQITTAAIALLGTFVTAYFGYQSVRVQNAAKTPDLPTVVAIVSTTTPTAVIPTATLETTATVMPLPSATVEPSPTVAEATPTTAELQDSSGLLSFGPFGAPCPGKYVLPDFIKPVHNSTEIGRQIYDSDIFSGVPIPEQDATFTGTSLLVSTVQGNEWMQVGNTMKIGISVQRAIPEHIDVVMVGQCGEGGNIRKFPQVELKSDYDSFEVSRTNDEFDFFKLEPGEYEVFEVMFACREPGLYRIQATVPFSSAQHQGVASQDEDVQVMCPKSYTLWDDYTIWGKLQFAGEYSWDGAKYVAAP